MVTHPLKIARIFLKLTTVELVASWHQNGLTFRRRWEASKEVSTKAFGLFLTTVRSWCSNRAGRGQIFWSCCPALVHHRFPHWLMAICWSPLFLGKPTTVAPLFLGAVSQVPTHRQQHSDGSRELCEDPQGPSGDAWPCRENLRSS